MKVHILDAEALQAITPASLAAYAKAEGWRRAEAYGNHSDIYTAEGKPEIVIPRTNGLGDYPSIVEQLIRIYAREAQSDELALYRDLTGADCDVIRVRAAGAEDDGSVAIDAGVDIVARSRDMLLAAACSVISPRPVYRAGANREANEYMQRVRLGQTERGSFVVTLFAPTPPQLLPVQGELHDRSDEPFERQVTHRLIDALEAAKEAVEAANSTDTSGLLKRLVGRGVSANLCEAVAGLIDQSDGLSISLTWALTRPALRPRSHVAFSRSDGGILREIARLNREKESRPDQTLLAYVQKLVRSLDDEEGEVTLKTLIDERNQSVFAILDKEDYALATQAHTNKAFVIATGELHRVRQRWHLRDASISLVPDNDDES
jgi:hypothetical protein